MMLHPTQIRKCKKDRLKLFRDYLRLLTRACTVPAVSACRRRYSQLAVHYRYRSLHSHDHDVFQTSSRGQQDYRNAEHQALELRLAAGKIEVKS